MTKEAANKNDIISTADSKRICQHMNEDHAVSVYAMAKKALQGQIKEGWKLSNTQLKTVTADGCQLSAVQCSGDLCERLTGELTFTPPLATKAECRPRLVALHQELLTPDIQWLVTKPAARGIWPTVLALGYGTLVLGIDGMVDLLENQMSFMGSKIVAAFGSAERLPYIICFLFWFSIVAHAAEAAYGFYHCRTTLKLGLKQQLLWAFMLFAVGGVVMFELLPLLAVANAANKKKEETKKKDS